MNTVLFCTQCGERLTSAMNFCPRCGSPVYVPQEEPRRPAATAGSDCVAPEDAVPEAPVVMPPPYVGNNQPATVVDGYDDDYENRSANSLGISGFILSMIAFLVLLLAKKSGFVDESTRIGVFGIVCVIGFVLSCCGLRRRPVGFAVAGLIINAVWVTFLLFFLAD